MHIPSHLRTADANGPWRGNGSFSRHLPDSIHPSKKKKKKKSLIPFNYHSLPVHLLFHHCWLQIYPCLNNIFPLYNQTTTTYSDNLRHSNYDFACRILRLRLVSLWGWGSRQITIYSEVKSWLEQHTKKIWIPSAYSSPPKARLTGELYILDGPRSQTLQMLLWGRMLHPWTSNL